VAAGDIPAARIVDDEISERAAAHSPWINVMHQQHPQSGPPQFLRSANWFFLIARSLAVSVEVFLHDPRTFGERYMGVQAALALAILFFYPALWARHDAGPMVGLLVAFLLMCGVVRVGTVARRVGGRFREHSYYTGRPWLMPRRAAGENRVKGVLEPVLVFFAGVFSSEFNKPLSSYLMLAAAGLFMSVQSSLMAERQRVLDLNDASIDQRRIMERWRDGSRD
jgi:hypothetical protein